MLNLQKLEIFAGVVRHGSFTETAKHFYMTQSAVSQHIQDLEAALGTKLFKRGRRGVTLTSSGETLFNYTKQILYLLAEAESAVTDVSKLVEGQTIIGATPTISVYLVPQWMREFRMVYNQLTVSLKTGTTSEIIERVLDHQLDIGFIEGELHGSMPSTLNSRTLTQIDLYLVVGKQHPLGDQKTVPVAALNDHPFVMRSPDSHTRRWMDALLAAHGITPRISAEFDSPESIKQAVAMGTCITILPDYAVREEERETRLSLLKVEGIALTRTLKLVWDPRMPLPPVTRAFIQFLTERYPALKDL
jgi:DNA-binding transcriptional LysR family regulator